MTLFYPASFKKNEPNSKIQWSWISLSGPDAEDFLHRLTTVHVKNLELNQGKKGCFLNAQGRLRAYFRLWKYAPSEFGFEFDAGESGRWKNELLSTIDQFTFAEKMTVTDVTSGMDCYWIFPDSPSISPELKPDHHLALDEEIRVCHHGSTDFGKPWITAWGRESRLKQWFETTFPQARSVQFDELEKWRISSNSPRIDREISELVNPLEVGLKDAIADHKGCYPGQEVIEKIISLGAPPRRLSRIEGDGVAPQLNEEILNLSETPVEVGKITSSLQLDGKYIALGLMKKIHAQEGLEVKFQKTGSRGVIRSVAPYTER